MTEKTENRGYNVPEAGETDWHKPVNENWKSIDADVQTVLEMAQAALDAATSDDGNNSEADSSGSGGTGFGWDQTHVDTQWLFDADADGNLTVETVTNLDASGSGSLAGALSAAESNDNTIIVFEVGGVIDRGGETYLRSRADNVYIAGQTAPSPGVTMIRGGIRVYGENVIVQHISFLPGDDIDSPGRARAITYNQDSSNILFDHCTAAWAPDTNVNFRDDTQGCAFINGINAEALNESSHPEAPHGYGLLIREGSQGVTYVGNLHTHNWKRNIKPNEDCRIVYGNNYIYNWGDRVWHGSSSSSECDWIGNVVEEGPDTDLSSGIFDGDPGAVYRDDNNLVIPSDMPLEDDEIEYVDSPQHLPSGLSPSDFVSSHELKKFLASMVGPRPADRPPVEQRMVDDFNNGNGVIIDNHADVGGYPDYDMKTRSLNVPDTNVLGWLQQYTDMVEETSQ
jgi:hypothetical protein